MTHCTRIVRTGLALAIAGAVLTVPAIPASAEPDGYTIPHPVPGEPPITVDAHACAAFEGPFGRPRTTGPLTDLVHHLLVKPLRNPSSAPQIPSPLYSGLHELNCDLAVLGI